MFAIFLFVSPSLLQATSKAHAASIESRLLSSYDYCWNRIGNASRRPLDALTSTQRMPISRRVACIMPSAAGAMARLGGERTGTQARDLELRVGGG